MCHPVLRQLDLSPLFVRRRNVASLRIVGKDRCAATEGLVGRCASHRPSTSFCDGDCIHVLRASANLRKAPNSFVLSVRMEQLDSHCTNFDESSYLSIFRKSVAKIQVSLKSDKITGTVQEDPHIISSPILLRMRDSSYSKTKAVEKIKSHILCSIIISPKILPFMK
jgi:hypothetical protein